MMKKRGIFIYRIILLICIIVGISLNFISKNNDWNLLLSYYTIQSNFIVAVFLVFEIINFFKPVKIFKEEKQYMYLKGMITLTILVTGLIFAIILSPYVKDWTGTRLYSSYLLHYISPFMTLIDYLLFDKSSTKLSIKRNLFWFIYPILYYLIGVVRVLFLDGFIPYPFLDVKTLGPIKSILYFVVLLSVFYILSILLVFSKNKIDNHKRIK